jgi:type II secretory pathway predicted ATPase ExeA
MSENPLGLRENPFRAGHHPKYVFPSREHQEALAHLRYGIQNREPFVLITGEVGTGKTTAVYDALGEWGSRAVIALITNPALSRGELLEEICLRFGVTMVAPVSKPQALSQLEHHLISLRTRGELAILLLDEAQNLDRELLEEIRLLSNLELQGEKLVQIFLIAQPELEAKLATTELRQLRQRIGIHYRIQPLQASETALYIRHRVAAAGGNGEELFTAHACAEIYRITHGIPREINLIAGQALLRAFVDDACAVTDEHVRAVQEELEFESVLSEKAASGTVSNMSTAAIPVTHVPQAAAAAEVAESQEAAAPEMPESQTVAPAASESPVAAEHPAPEPELTAPSTAAESLAAYEDEQRMATVAGPEALEPIMVEEVFDDDEWAMDQAAPANVDPMVDDSPAHDAEPTTDEVLAHMGGPVAYDLPEDDPEPMADVVNAPYADQAARNEMEEPPPQSSALDDHVEASPLTAASIDLGRETRTPLLPSWFDQVVAQRREKDAQAARAATAAAAASSAAPDPATAATPEPAPFDAPVDAPVDAPDMPTQSARSHDEEIRFTSEYRGESQPLPMIDDPPEQAVATEHATVGVEASGGKLWGLDDSARSALPWLALLFAALVIATGAVGAVLLIRYSHSSRAVAPATPAGSPAPAAPVQPPAPTAQSDSLSAAPSGAGGSTVNPATAAASPPAAAAPGGGSNPATTDAGAKPPSSAAATTPADRGASPPRPADGSSGGFGIAVGTFLSEERALTQRTILSGRTRLPSRMIELNGADGTPMYRVVVGAFQDRASAERAAGKLVDDGLVTEAQVVALPTSAAVKR